MIKASAQCKSDTRRVPILPMYDFYRYCAAHTFILARLSSVSLLFHHGRVLRARKRAFEESAVGIHDPFMVTMTVVRVSSSALSVLLIRRDKLTIRRSGTGSSWERGYLVGDGIRVEANLDLREGGGTEGLRVMRISRRG